MSNYEMVLHVDKTDGSLRVALGNAAAFAKALQNESYKMVLVVNSRAVTELKANDNPELAEPLEKAVSLGLEVRVCQGALRGMEIDPKDLFPQCTLVPGGTLELVRLQKQGYAYIKP